MVTAPMTASLRLPRTWRARCAAASPLLLVGALSLPVLNRAPLTANEVATWSAATRPWRTLPRLLAHQDAVFTVYYAAMHLWLGLVGVSPAALRAPSALAALLCVLLTARLARSITSSAAVGVVAGACLAVNPFFLYYAIDARPYTLVAAVAVMTTTLLLEPGRGYAMPAFAALSLLGVWLQLMFLLVLASQALGLLVCRRHLLRRLRVPLVAVALGTAPLAVLAWQQRRQVGWLSPSTPSGSIRWWVHLVQVPAAAAAVLALLAAAGFVVLVRRQRTPAVLLVLIATVPSLTLVVVSSWLPLYDPRYVIESTPAVAVLVATACIEAWQRLSAGQGRRRPTVMAAGAACVAGLALLPSAAIAWTHQHRAFFYENAAGAARLIRASAGTGAAMIAVPGEARGALYYYLDGDQDGDLPVRDISAVPGQGPVVTGNFSGSQASSGAVAAAAAGYGRLLVVTLGQPDVTQVLDNLRLAGECSGASRQAFGQLVVTTCLRRAT